MGEFRENVLPPMTGSSPVKSVVSDNNDSSKLKLKKFNLEQPKTYENFSPMLKGSPSGSDNLQAKFITEALDAHNECRRKHSTPNLTHNPELSKIAQAWANTIASRNSMQHSKSEFNNEKLGENIAMWFETGATHYDGMSNIYFLKRLNDKNIF